MRRLVGPSEVDERREEVMASLNGRASSPEGRVSNDLGKTLDWRWRCRGERLCCARTPMPGSGVRLVGAGRKV